MADTIVATGSVLDLLPSAEKLLGERANIVRRLAPLRALYGGNGYMAERRIKGVEARLDGAIRARWDAAGEKTTEPKIAAAIREHPDYIQALTDDLTQREQWCALEEQLTDVDWRLRMRQSDAALLAAEARLTGISQ